jgi:hypothetical protein
MAVDGNISLFFLADGIHFNDAGSMYAANLIYNDLKQRILGGSVPHAPKAQETTRSLVFAEQNCDSPPALKPDGFFEARRVTEISARYPVFSNDGSWFLFQSWTSGKEAIYGVRKGDSRILRLSPTGGSVPNERHPSIIQFSDIGLRFVFGSGYSHGSRNLERLMVREWPQMTSRELVPDKALGGSIPAVHGNSVYFAGYTMDGPLSTPNILSLNLETGEIEYKTKDQNEDWRPALSREGDLAFISKRGSKFELFEMKKSGDTKKLIEHDADIWDPAYSYNGEYIAFAARVGEHWAIKVLVRKTGKVVQLTDGRQDDWDPVFHPSGNALYFGRSYGREPYIYALCLDLPRL